MCISHPSDTPWGKGRTKDRSQEVECCYAEYPLCTETAHISQGFNQGLQIGCEGSQMTSRPQFPPCSIKKSWFLTLGGGVTSPFENLLLKILIPLKCTFPLISAYHFREFVWLANSNPSLKIQGLGNTKIFLELKKKLQTKIVPHIHGRFIVYKALLIPQTPIGRGGN